MQDLPVYFAIAGFLAMGIGALLKPRLVTAQFDIPELSAASRSEVCAVYGGFGVNMAVVLGLAPQQLEAHLLHDAAALRSGPSAFNFEQWSLLQ
ncbi:hypothetical protein [Ideonella sp.]|uniref:hypothetical protein n=1 Tax=Ideonella sp. TaxID=1929293 RepID=UPI003BB7897E